jgi:hypothetical protein
MRCKPELNHQHQQNQSIYLWSVSHASSLFSSSATSGSTTEKISFAVENCRPVPSIAKAAKLSITAKHFGLKLNLSGLILKLEANGNILRIAQPNCDRAVKPSMAA